MMLFWIAGGLLLLLLLAAGFFYALYLGTHEPVPLERARMLWRWALVVVLGTFDWWIFARVAAGIRALM